MSSCILLNIHCRGKRVLKVERCHRITNETIMLILIKSVDRIKLAHTLRLKSWGLMNELNAPSQITIDTSFKPHLSLEIKHTSSAHAISSWWRRRALLGAPQSNICQVASNTYSPNTRKRFQA